MELTTQTALSMETLSALVLNGDLSKLSPAQTVEYYRVYCERIGLDPATQPFAVITMNGKKKLYCDRSGTAQLNKLHSVSHKITNREKVDELYIVTVQASTPDGRVTECIGAVSIAGLKGEALCNAMMKGETKGKRRSTLDLLGLGILDESELETINAGGLGVSDNPRPKALTAPPESDEEMKEQKASEVKARKLRADLNKLLQPCKNAEEFKAGRSEFRTKNNLGREIWKQKTCHNEIETFEDLVNEHWARIDSNLRLDAEIEKDVDQWKSDLLACSDLKTFEELEARMGASSVLRDNTLYADMLKEKGKSLGFTYAEDLE